MLNWSPCCSGFIFFWALVTPVYVELEPLLLWFYFIWGPCCSCLFWIRALVARVTGSCGDTVSAMAVTKKYYLLYFASSVLVLGTCCCFLVLCRCLLAVHSDPSGHLLRPWSLWSPPLRSASGDRVWLSMAARHPQPSNLLQHQQQTSLPFYLHR